MTKVFFVRHAQPERSWRETRTRPLAEEGKKDSKMVLEFFKENDGRTMIIMKMVESLLPWFRNVI